MRVLRIGDAGGWRAVCSGKSGAGRNAANRLFPAKAAFPPAGGKIFAAPFWPRSRPCQATLRRSPEYKADVADGAAHAEKNAASPPDAGQPDLPQGKAILLALLFGDRQYLSQSTLDNFAAATLVHSLALSGQHLAVAGLLGLICVLAAARLARPAVPRASARDLGRGSRLAAGADLSLAGQCPGLAAAGDLHALCADVLAGSRPLPHHAGCALRRPALHHPCFALERAGYGSATFRALRGGHRAFPAPVRRMPPSPSHEKRKIEAQSLWRRGSRWLLRILLISLLIQSALLPLNLLLFGNAGFWFPLNALWLPAADLLALPARCWVWRWSGQVLNPPRVVYWTWRRAPANGPRTA